MRVSSTVYHTGQHLSEDEMLPPGRSCPLCMNTTGRRPVLRLQDEPAVDLLHCPQCSGYSASRMPTDAALEEYYRRYYRSSSMKVTCDAPPAFASHLAPVLQRLLRRADIEMLDFGGGDGSLAISIAVALNVRTARIIVVDYNADVATGVPSQFCIEHRHSLDAAGACQFDIVLASAVLEHIPDPRPALVSLLNSLRPGGVMYARTPWMTPILRILKRLGIAADFTYPGHVHDMGAQFWTRCLGLLPVDADEFRIVSDGPSPLETSFRRRPLRSTAAYLMKTPARLFGTRYPFVGGWEVFIRRNG